MAHRPDLRRQIDPGVAVEVQVGDEASRLAEVGRLAKRLRALEGFSRKAVRIQAALDRVSTLESSSTIMIFFMAACRENAATTLPLRRALFAGGAGLQENISRGLVDFSQSPAVMRHRLAGTSEATA